MDYILHMIKLNHEVSIMFMIRKFAFFGNYGKQNECMGPCVMQQSNSVNHIKTFYCKLNTIKIFYIVDTEIT